jgi:hypothetical protein
MSIEIFYHMYCVNDCVDRFIKTYNKLHESGLVEACNNINVVLVGDDKVGRYETQINYLKKVKTQCHSSETFGEMNTIKAIQYFAQTTTDAQVLYLHSKGVSRGVNKNIEAWVNYMEYFLIENYQNCLEKLKEYDTVGVDFYDKPMKHYSGNFWWANSSYVKTLPDFETGLNSGLVNEPRWYCEFWLLNGNCSPCNLHSSNRDLYGAVYEPLNYKK